MPKLPNDVLELRRSYKEWEPTKKFIAWASGVDPTPEETRTLELTEEVGLKPDEAKELIDGIDELGLGKFTRQELRISRSRDHGRIVGGKRA